MTILTLRCAWCLREQGIQPQEQDSHGICTHHAELVMQEYLRLKAARHLLLENDQRRTNKRRTGDVGMSSEILYALSESK